MTHVPKYVCNDNPENVSGAGVPADDGWRCSVVFLYKTETAEDVLRCGNNPLCWPQFTASLEPPLPQTWQLPKLVLNRVIPDTNNDMCMLQEWRWCAININCSIVLYCVLFESVCFRSCGVKLLLVFSRREWNDFNVYATQENNSCWTGYFTHNGHVTRTETKTGTDVSDRVTGAYGLLYKRKKRKRPCSPGNGRDILLLNGMLKGMWCHCARFSYGFPLRVAALWRILNVDGFFRGFGPKTADTVWTSLTIQHSNGVVPK